MERSSLLPGSWKRQGGSASRTGARAIITPEGNSYIERFHRSLKEEEVGTAEYRGLGTGLIAESEIAVRTRLSWLSKLY